MRQTPSEYYQSTDDLSLHSWKFPSLDRQRDELLKLYADLMRKKWLIISIVIVITLAVAALSFQLPVKYTATAQVLVDPKSSRFIQSEPSFGPGAVVDREAIESEILILSSRKLLGRVVDEMDLMDDPEFNTSLRPKSGFSAFIGGVKETISRFLGLESGGAKLPSESELRTQVVDELSDSLVVSREGQSRVITISVTVGDPQDAASIANKISELYLVEHLETKFSQRKRTQSWLQDRLGELRSASVASERAVEEYRTSTGLFETIDAQGRSTRIDTQQLMQLSTELVQARADLTTLEAKLRQIERLRGSGRLEVIPEVIENPVIATMRTQEVRVLQRIADLETDLGPRHPRIVAARVELSDIRSSIRKEVDRVISSVRNEVDRARGRVTRLQASLKDLERRTAEQNALQIQLNELAREAEANQTILEQFLDQTKEISARQVLQEPDARIIESAEPPLIPSKPKKKIIVVLAFFGALALACAFVLVSERLNAGFRREEDVEEATGLRVLGVIPTLPGRRKHRKNPQALPDHVINMPFSSFSEALMAMHTTLVTGSSGTPPKSVLFTSSYPGEGKSTLAACFARAVAAQGRRVVLIDADLRRPRIAEALDLQPKPGLAEVLLEQASLDEAIQKDRVANLSVISSGAVGHAPQKGLLAENRMASVLRALATEFDLTVVDSPPLLVVSDALFLSSCVASTVLVVRWNDTQREDVFKAVKQLRDSKARVSGVALNLVNLRSYAGYAYSKPGAYLKAYRRYYGISD